VGGLSMIYRIWQDIRQREEDAAVLLAYAAMLCQTRRVW